MVAVHLLPLRSYVRRAKRDGVRTLALGYVKGGQVIVWGLAVRVPWYGRRLLLHELWHVREGKMNKDHAPWWTFRIECGHALRFRDPAGLLGTEPWP